MRYLFLDDIRVPYSENNIADYSAYHYTRFEPFKNKHWIIVRSYYEFVHYITRNGIDDLFISFDNDLGDIYNECEKTGYDAAKWLVDCCIDNNLQFPGYFVHSMNPIGKENIITYIENFKKVNY